MLEKAVLYIFNFSIILFCKRNSVDFQKQIKFIETVDCDYYDEEYELYKNRVKQFNTVLNLIQKHQKEIEELKTKYDKDTHTLQNQLDVANADRVEKDKIIDEMAARVYLTKEEREEMEKDIYNNVNHKGFADFVKRYIKMKVRKEND